MKLFGSIIFIFLGLLSIVWMPTRACAEDPVPLLQQSKSGSLGRLEQLYFAAENALSAGLADIAARQFAELLKADHLSPDMYNLLTRGLASALIAQGKFQEVIRVLQAYKGIQDVAYYLRLAIAAYQQKEKKMFDKAFSEIDVQKLTVQDRPWYYLLEGLKRQERGDIEAQESFKHARTLSTSQRQMAQFEYIIALTGKASKSQIKTLKKQLTAYQGKPIAGKFAQQLAIMHYRLGQREEAIEVLREQLKNTNRKAQKNREAMLVLLAYFAGEGAEQGRLALQEVLASKGSWKYQQMALYLLARSQGGSQNPEAFKEFLDSLIEDKEEHPLLAALLLMRAHLYLENMNLSEANADVQSLLKKFPASNLRNNAVRMLAHIALRRDPPQYRTAANYLKRLSNAMPEGVEKGRLSILAADAYFLNEDYENASQMYRKLLDVNYAAFARGAIFYQAVLSEIHAGQMNRAQKILDRPDFLEEVDPINRWRAEWNYIIALKREHSSDRAFKRIYSILSLEKSTSIPLELMVRLMWLEVQLSLESGLFEEVPRLVGKLDAFISELTEEALPRNEREEILSSALLLKAQAWIKQKKLEKGLQGLRDVRTQYPNTEASVLSYITEAREYAAQGRTVEAQQHFVELVDHYPNSSHVPMALYEAALSAERRSTKNNYQDALSLLERLCTDYSGSALVFSARLKQGDLLRKLNNFGAAQLIYENLINQYPQHSDRYRAEISRADCLMAQASSEGSDLSVLDEAATVYERLFDLNHLPIELRVEAGHKWGHSLSQQKKIKAAKDAYWLVISNLLLNYQDVSSLGVHGPSWMSRTIIKLAELFEAENKQQEAQDVYALIHQYKLPGQSIVSSKASS